MKVAVIGAGLIGRAWAIVFARGGADVALYDSAAGQAEAAALWVERSLDDMQSFGLVTDPAAILKRVAVASSLASAVDGAGYLQESIAERLQPKQALYAEIEALASRECILASSSSAILPSAIFATVEHKDRTLVAHPMNPPHLAPIVELCGSAATAAGTFAAARSFLESCGMSVVTLRGEVEGFILNRLQLALMSEAFRLIEAGYVTPEDLDKTLKDGLALRWAFLGPVETIDLNAPGGVDDYIVRYGPTYRRIAESQRQAPDWTEKAAGIMAASRRAALPLDKIAEATARRDLKLMALLAMKMSPSNS